MRAAAVSVAALAGLLGANGQAVHQAFNSQMSFIIKTLTDAKNEIAEMKEEETVQHTAYSTYCTTTKDNTAAEISKLGNEMQTSQARQETEAANSKNKDEEAKEHGVNIGEWTGELNELETLRAKNKHDFELLNTDLTESIDAVKHAVAYLESGQIVVKESDAVTEFLQVNGHNPDAVRSMRRMYAFLSAPTDDGVVWEKKNTSSVTAMLKKLQTKFESERASAQKTETEQAHAFSLQKKSLSDSILTAKSQKQAAEEASGIHNAASGQAGEDLASQTASKKAQEDVLKELTGQCQKAAELYARRQAGQEKDVAAFDNAIKVLSGGGASLLERRHSSTKSFIQLDSRRTTNDDSSVRLQRMKDFLQRAAATQRNAGLMQLATTADPFEKVKELINQLIVRLQNEGAQEESEQAWCNTEMKKNNKDKDDRSTKVEKLKTRIERFGAEVEQKEREVQDAKENVVSKNAELAEATKIRNDEKALYSKAKAELETMETNLEKAIEIIENVSLVQTVSVVKKKQPAYEPTGEYESRGGDVVGLLSNLKSQTSAELAAKNEDEATSNRAYNDAKNELSVAIASSESQIQVTEQAIVQRKKDIQTNQSDLTDEQKLLDEANGYYENLQAKCVHAQSTEQRAEARNEEIESLKQALEILEGEI